MRERQDRYFLRGCFADTTVEADPGTGGAEFAVDDAGVGGVWPYGKMAWGASGTQTAVAAGAAAVPIQDGGNSITVDGTVAVTGVSTAAKQDTGNTSLGSIDGKITACNTGAVVISSGTVTTVGAVTAITNALPAGTNAIGKLAANSGVDIGDVDVTSVPADPFGANADAASATGSISAKLRFIAATGIPVTGSVAVTNAGLTELAAAINGSAQMDVNLAASNASVAVTNAGTFAVQNNGTGKTLKTASGTLTADTDVIAAVSSKRIKVYAYSVITVGTSANAAIFKSNGTAGTELWRFLIQGASGSPMGINLAVSPPAFLFATVAGEKLTLDVGNADTLHYSIAYFDDDAT